MWPYIAFYVVTSILAYLLAPEPQAATTENAVPQEGEAPPALTSGKIPVVFGTIWVTPNVVWYGDLSTEPIQECTEAAAKK
jgi:hypothetical protein